MLRTFFRSFMAFFSVLLFLCASARAEQAFTLSSSDFQPGTGIPARFSCDATGDSPALHWSAPPNGTRSFALVLRDPDAPHGTYIHWVLYNLPAHLRSLPPKLPPAERLPNGARQGLNSAQSTGYTGPCPPPGPTHHYVFTLYALDTELQLAPEVTEPKLMQSLRGHVRATAQLTGLYRH